MTSLTEKEPTRPGGRGARTRILNAASELFYFEGINATGVGRIASKASVSKRTLYQHFPSKTALVEEYLRQLRQEAGEAEGTSAEKPETTPRAQLLALFDIADGGDARMRGCPFHNAAVEAAGVMPASRAHRPPAQARLRGWARRPGPTGGRGGPGDAGQPDRAALRGCVCTVDLAQRSGALGACPSGGRGPHFDVVAAARTASLTAVGVIATTVFWARLTKSSR